MIPYYGRHNDKQYIRGKLVRFGFKLCSACASNGTLLHIKPYCDQCGPNPGPRNNFAEVLSITGSGNLFFWRTL